MPGGAPVAGYGTSRHKRNQERGKSGWPVGRTETAVPRSRRTVSVGEAESADVQKIDSCQTEADRKTFKVVDTNRFPADVGR